MDIKKKETYTIEMTRDEFDLMVACVGETNTERVSSICECDYNDVHEMYRALVDFKENS